MAAAIKITRHVGMNGTPAVMLGSMCEVEMAELGHSREVVTLNWSYDALIAWVGGEAVGCIIYDQRPKSDKDFWVMTGYVLPQHRGSGVYRALWDELVRAAQEAKVDYIRGSTGSRNLTMRAIARALGRVEESVNTSFKVPATTPPPTGETAP